MTASLAIGVDVGATKIAAILADRSGHVLAEERPHRRGGGRRGRRASPRLCKRCSVPRRAHHAGVGVGIPATSTPRRASYATPSTSAGRKRTCRPAAPRSARQRCQRAGAGRVLLQLPRKLRPSPTSPSAPAWAAASSSTAAGHGATWRRRTRPLIAWTRRVGCAPRARGCVETVVSGPGILATASEHLACGGAPRSALREAGLTPENVLDAALARPAWRRRFSTRLPPGWAWSSPSAPSCSTRSASSSAAARPRRLRPARSRRSSRTGPPRRPQSCAHLQVTSQVTAGAVALARVAGRTG